MFKNKQVVVSGLTALVVIGAVAGISLTTHKSKLSAQEIADNAASAAQAQADSSSSSSQTQAPTANSTQASGNLQAMGSSSNVSGGQLGTGGQSLLGQGTAQSGGASDNSGGSSGTNPFDPSTFAQYDKYKNETNALMADAQAGDGATLEAGKTAVVYYRGWLTNGTMFDQSRTGSDGKMQPFSFVLGQHQVISGWEQGLAGMKVGGVRLLIVPPSVGYGATGQGSIPPNSVLVFQVQLLAVQ